MAKVNKEISGIDKVLMALGLKEYVKTASEDDIAKVITRGVAMDEDESEAEDEDTHPKGCKCSDCMDSKGKDAKDAKASDARKRFHDALDKVLDGKEEEQQAQDEDMEALKGLFQAKSEASDEKEEQEKSEAEDSEEESEAEDEAVEDEASTPIPEADRAKSPAPSAVDAATVLKALKPFVAQSNDKRLKKAFDTASALVKGGAKRGNGSYKEFARASKATGKDAAEQLDTRTKAAKVAEEINNEYKKMRGVNKVSK